MLKFTKGIIKNTDSKIVSNYQKNNDFEKLNEIRRRLHPEIVNKEIKPNHKEKVDLLRKKTN